MRDSRGVLESKITKAKRDEKWVHAQCLNHNTCLDVTTRVYETPQPQIGVTTSLTGLGVTACLIRLSPMLLESFYLLLSSFGVHFIMIY